MGRFEQRMQAQLRRYFPGHYRLMGEQAALEALRHCIRRAAGHRINTERDVCLYTTLGFLLGSNFDQDLLLPWNKPTLPARPNLWSRSFLNHLREQARDYLREVNGPDNRHLVRSLVRLRRHLYRIGSLALPSDELMPMLLSHCSRLFPQRFRLAGEATLARLLQESVSQAQRSWQLHTPGGAALYALCTFYLGSTFETDPLAQRPLRLFQESRDMEPSSRVQRLCRQFDGLLGEWLAPRQGGTSSWR